MTLEWYCKIMGDEWGPMSAQELVAVARHGRLTRNDTVRKGPQGTWVRAERVRGLFESAATSAGAGTVSDGNEVSVSSSTDSAAAKRHAIPAKRSVLNVPLPRFWVRSGNQMTGPFSEPQIRQLAAEGKLKPHYLLSKDRRRWVRAAQVKGLAFGGASPEAATMSVRSAVWPLTEFAADLKAADEAADDANELVAAGSDM